MRIKLRFPEMDRDIDKVKRFGDMTDEEIMMATMHPEIFNADDLFAWRGKEIKYLRPYDYIEDAEGFEV